MWGFSQCSFGTYTKTLLRLNFMISILCDTCWCSEDRASAKALFTHETQVLHFAAHQKCLQSHDRPAVKSSQELKRITHFSVALSLRIGLTSHTSNQLEPSFADV